MGVVGATTRRRDVAQSPTQRFGFYYDVFDLIFDGDGSRENDEPSGRGAAIGFVLFLVHWIGIYGDRLAGWCMLETVHSEILHPLGTTIVVVDDDDNRVDATNGAFFASIPFIRF